MLGSISVKSKFVRSWQNQNWVSIANFQEGKDIDNIATHLKENFIQLHEGNALAQTLIFPISPNQPQTSFHFFQCLAIGSQPTIRVEKHTIFTVNLLATLNSPCALSNFCTTRNKDAIDGIAFRRRYFGNQACCGRPNSSSLLNCRLKKWEGFGLLLADDFAFPGHGVNLGLESLVDERVGNDEKQSRSNCCSGRISSGYTSLTFSPNSRMQGLKYLHCERCFGSRN